jgi:hypothetical protein
VADTKITNLTSASASSGDELVVSTTALSDRKVTAESIANLAKPYIITQTSAYVGTTAGTAQKMFDASTGSAGALNVGPSMTYLFETAFTITGRSTLTHVVSYGFGGTAAIDRQGWTCFANTGGASSVPGTPTMVRCSVNNSPINLTNTSSTMVVFAKGKLTIGTSGTIIPQITRSASVVALTIAPDAYFAIRPIGSTSFTVFGPWS